MSLATAQEDCQKLLKEPDENILSYEAFVKSGYDEDADFTFIIFSKEELKEYNEAMKDFNFEEFIKDVQDGSYNDQGIHYAPDEFE
jgi:hypothetical protein